MQARLRNLAHAWTKMGEAIGDMLDGESDDEESHRRTRLGWIQRCQRLCLLAYLLRLQLLPALTFWRKEWPIAKRWSGSRKSIVAYGQILAVSPSSWGIPDELVVVQLLAPQEPYGPPDTDPQLMTTKSSSAPTVHQREALSP